MSQDIDTDLYAVADDAALWFGKYKGRTVATIADIDPSYLIWAHDNVEGFKLPMDRYEELSMFVEDDEDDGLPELDFND